MVLFLLLFILGTAAGIISAVSAGFLGRPRFAGAAAAFLVVWAALYFAALGWSSRRSEARTLAPQEEFRLGGFLLDAHFLFSVDQVKQIDVLATNRQRVPKGIFYAVTVKYRSDAGRAELHPPALDLTILDRAGRRFQALDKLPHLPPLRPGESGVLDVVFDLPRDVDEPRLLLRSGEPLDRWLGSMIIDDEESLGHKRTTFLLPPIAPRSGKGD